MTDKIQPVPRYKTGTSLPRKYRGPILPPPPLPDEPEPIKQTEPELGKIIDVYG